MRHLRWPRVAWLSMRTRKRRFCGVEGGGVVVVSLLKWEAALVVLAVGFFAPGEVGVVWGVRGMVFVVVVGVGVGVGVVVVVDCWAVEFVGRDCTTRAILCT
jgi:hypothetical protein